MECNQLVYIIPKGHKLRLILDFKLSRNQIHGSEFSTGEVDFARWFPVAFLINGVFVTRGGFELTTPVL